jgi:exopolysaccharide biosynthesis protein
VSVKWVCQNYGAEGRGVVLRPGQFSVQATGLDATSLLDLVGLGCLKRTDKLIDSTGHKVPLTASTYAVNGRYQLLRDGKVVAPTGSDPFLARAPRTVAGTAADGRILLLTIDGRSRTSVGATLTEAANVAKSLGMVQAVNLDGGGSSTMSVDGHASNKPSDGHERPVGDALVYVPAPWRPQT